MKHSVRIVPMAGLVATLVACGGSKAPVEPVQLGPKTVTIKPRELVAEANVAASEGRFQDAVKTLDGLLVEQPDNTVAYYNRGFAHQQLGNWSEAEADYKAVLERNPDDLQAALNLGAIYKELDREAEAITLYEKMLEKDEFNGDLLNNLSILYREKWQFDEAEQAIRKLLMRDKNNVDAYKNLALIEFDQKKFKLAETILENARRMSEEQKRTDPDIYVNLGIIYLGRNEKGRAMAAFKKALELDPKHVEANYNIGSLALAHRDYDLAATSYEAVADAQPLNAEVAAYLAYAKQGQQKYEEAVVQVGRAWELQKKRGSSADDQVLYQAMVITQSANDLDKAQSYAEEYLKLKNITCSEEDFDGVCGRYNGILLTKQMAAEAAAAAAPPEEEKPEATGQDIFTEEDVPEGTEPGVDPEADPAAAPEGGDAPDAQAAPADASASASAS